MAKKNLEDWSDEFPGGISKGKPMASPDMKKREINDSSGNQIGPWDSGQPEYDIFKNRTGKVYPEHYHIDGHTGIHYVPY